MLQGKGILFSIFILSILVVNADKKKRSENDLPMEKFNDDEFELRNLERPFRVAKLNLVWKKAQHRVTDPKLMSLYTQLKLLDKEEIMYKQMKEKDKDKVIENELREKLVGVLSTYDLLEHFDDTQNPEKTKQYTKPPISDNYKNKSLFKDKRLNMLWDKAESAGFTRDELKALREEFQHHQEELDKYYKLINTIEKAKKKEYKDNAVNEEELPHFNEIEEKTDVVHPKDKEPSYTDHVNALREHHRGVRSGYEKLERSISQSPNHKDFIEPKVQGLWKVALNSNFSDEELLSLKSELLHFEGRLLKLRHLNAEHAIQKQKHEKTGHNIKESRLEEMEHHIKKQSRKVEKLQEELEKKVYRHTEL